MPTRTDPSPTRPTLILLGGGGHARVLLDALALADRAVGGVLDDDPGVKTDVPRLGTLAQLADFDPGDTELVNAIGSADLPETRHAVYEYAIKQGFGFTQVVHPAATLAISAACGQGTQVLAGSVIGPGTTLADNVLVNTRAGIDHDCHIGPHTHLAPGVTLCGGVRVGEGCHIGCGATVIQGVAIGNRVVVGAGAVVTQDLPAGSRVAGVPAGPIGS